MSRDEGFATYVAKDLLGFIPGITVRGMFGGHGLYLDGRFFCILSDGEIYFKVGDTNRDKYEQAGSKQFTYERSGKQQTLSYYTLPPEVMDDQDLLRQYVEESAALQK